MIAWNLDRPGGVYSRAGTERRVREAVGTIGVIQEGRFRLDTEDGRSLQFTLYRNAPVEPQDLDGFRGARVRVLHDGSAGMTALVARDVRRVRR